MAFPTVQGTTGATNESANATSHTPTLPTVSGGVLQNDILVAFYGKDGAGTASWHADWTEIIDVIDDASACSLHAAYYRVPSDGTTPTVTNAITTTASERGSIRTYCLRGCHTSTAPEVASLRSSGAGTVPDPPSLTASWGAEDNLWIALNAHDDLDTTTAYPTNYTLVQEQSTSSGTGSGGVGVAMRQLNNATQDPGTFTISASEEWIGHTVVFRPAPSGTNASAGNAAATGTANQPYIAAVGIGSSTGTAPQPEATIGALAASPTAAGSAPQPTVSTASGANAPAGSAAGSGAAPQPVASIGAKPQPATVIDGGDTSTPPTDIVDAGDGSFTDFVDLEAFCTAVGEAPQPEATVAPNAGGTAATGTAPQPEATVAPLAGAAAATGAALQATVDTSTAATNAPAGLAAAIGTANQATAQVAPFAASPTAAGAANVGKADIDAKTNTATATGAADGQTVQTGTFANAPAGLAAATGTANPASTTIRPNAAVGLAAGVANQSEAELGVKAGFGSSTGAAPQPTVAFGALALAGVATATGAANGPKIDLDINAGTGTATGEAFGVFALVGNPLGPPQTIGAVADDDHSLTARDHPVGLMAVDDRHSLEV